MVRNFRRSCRMSASLRDFRIINVLNGWEGGSILKGRGRNSEVGWKGRDSPPHLGVARPIIDN